MTKFIALNCPACAGPLRVDLKSTSVDCDFCDAHTELHRIDGAFELHLVNLLGETKQELRDEFRIVRVQNAIRELDHRWKVAEADLLEQSPMRIRTNGKESSRTGAVGCGLITNLILTVPAVTLAYVFREFPYVSAVFAVIALLGFLDGLVTIGNYYKLLVKRERMHTVYQTRRQRLLQRLQTAKRSANH